MIHRSNNEAYTVYAWIEIITSLKYIFSSNSFMHSTSFLYHILGRAQKFKTVFLLNELGIQTQCWATSGRD